MSSPVSSLSEPTPHEREARALLARAERATVSVEGRRLALLDWGGDGPLVLLHHANGFSKGTFALVADALTPDFRVVAMDARGHGDSDPAPAAEGYAWSGFAEDLRRVAETLCRRTGRRRVALGVGHSFGGTSLLGAASRAPRLFERLLLVDPVMPPRPVGGPGAPGGPSEERREHLAELIERAARRRTEWPSREEARTWFAERPLFAGFDPRALELYLLDGLREREDGSLVLRCAGAVEAEVFARGEDVDVPALARGVEVPTLLLWAERGNFPRALFDAVAASMARARVEAVASGHLVPMERPDLVAGAARRFVAEGAGAASRSRR